MSIADTNMSTIGSLFFIQIRQLSVAAARKKYKSELGEILDAYAPESSKLYRQRFAVYR